jgi:dTDP-4-amino-4,6-dideoxygalactose transaminase
MSDRNPQGPAAVRLRSGRGLLVFPDTSQAVTGVRKGVRSTARGVCGAASFPARPGAKRE